MRSQFLTKIDKRVLSLAYPIILANISIPLLGLTDTAVIGHLGALDVLAGISIGAVLMGSIYWFFGFLRMGVTGLVAQARGANEYVEVASILVRGLVIAAVGGIILIAFHSFLFSAIFYFLVGAKDAEKLAMEYMSIRVFGAPFAISMFVFVGVWLGGLFYDIYGSYDIVWWVGIGVGAFSAIIHLPIKETPLSERKLIPA